MLPRVFVKVDFVPLLLKWNNQIDDNSRSYPVDENNNAPNMLLLSNNGNALLN